MGRRGVNNPRQKRSKLCGCALCLVEYPGARKKRRDCIGSWQARYRNADGEQKAENFPTKKKADAFLDEVRTNVRKGTYYDPKRGQITVGAWWELWWPAQSAKGRITTRNRKLAAWNAHIEKAWGKRRLNSLEYMELQTWLTNEVKGNVTQTKVLELFRAMLRDAVRDGKRIPFNPLAEVEVTARPVAKHPDDLKPPTLEQYELVRAQLPVYYRVLVDFAQDTGMRWGEYTGLRRCNVDLEAGVVYVREVIVDDHGRQVRQAAPKTDAGFRTVPLTPKAAAAVQAMIDRLDPAPTQSAIEDGMHPEEIIFRGPKAAVLNRNNFRRIWIPAIKAAGIARMVVNPDTGRHEWWPRVHDYKHAMISRLHAAGVSEKDAQLVVGHERGARVTWHYTHGGGDAALVAVRDALTPGRRLRAVPGGQSPRGVHKESTNPARSVSEHLGDSSGDAASAS